MTWCTWTTHWRGHFKYVSNLRPSRSLRIILRSLLPVTKSLGHSNSSFTVVFQLSILYQLRFYWTYFYFLVLPYKQNMYFCSAIDLNSHEDAAVKLEECKTKHPQLHIECKFYKVGPVFFLKGKPLYNSLSLSRYRNIWITHLIHFYGTWSSCV